MPSMETLEQLTKNIAEARAAYHRLLVGSSVRELMDQNGERVQYTPANRGALSAYISGLQARIDAMSGVPSSLGPMEVWLG
jgi:hypothetical protein